MSKASDYSRELFNEDTICDTLAQNVNSRKELDVHVNVREDDLETIASKKQRYQRSAIGQVQSDMS
ncbi:hypothetical protein N7471_008537 [Penicillium samsonianum]|uniref:uncharacterized protein n=1 Tax=Penicillium samsonianum TaxID=1882272 RepID=UPI0025472CA9|nr:uncharacterized protein N7471_008537 [Penicillium samsonianum]KAJ6133322.1 hypothetical protein N7471_008537 [Penicillium samsonianum]